MAIAEGISGSEANFAKVMTEEARRIGMKKSTFMNATGLYDPNHLMTARELAILGRYIITEYPDQYPVFGQKEFDYRNHKFYNRNPLLALGIGADGLKTGHTTQAGFGLVGSAVQDGKRLIVVVMGLENENQRRDEAAKILEWGFKSFAIAKVYDDGEIVYKAPLKPPVKKGDQVAVLRITSTSSAQTEVPLFATEDVEKAGIVRQGIDSLVLMALRRLAL
jgi:D-alanyl-D-alanine carboxypeptidase (penicillin-binding protein 5/6)